MVGENITCVMTVASGDASSAYGQSSDGNDGGIMSSHSYYWSRKILLVCMGSPRDV